MAIIDTLQSARKLRESGVEDPQAEAIVEVVEEATETATDDLATKADLAAVRADLAELKAATKADIAELKADLYRAMWFFGVGIIAVNLTALGIATGLIIAFA